MGRLINEFKLHLRIKYLLVVLLFSTIRLAAQPFGNEWIDYNQTYYKIPVAETGIYRITYNNLLDAGFPVNQVDPRRIQLFHRGVEQAIIVQGQQDASFDSNDYIEFYGERNDGTLDQELYLDPTYQPHTYYNLFSDSSAYFLTWLLAPVNGKRMPLFSENNVSAIPTEVNHLNELLTIYTDQYSRGRVYPEGGNNANAWMAQYDLGEGWIGQNIQLGQFLDISMQLDKTDRSGDAPLVELGIVGNNNRDHDVIIEVGPNAGSLRELITVAFSYHQNYLIQERLEWTDVDANGDLVVRIRVDGVGGADVVAPTYIKVSYFQNFDMDGESFKVFNMPEKNTDKSYVEISNALGTISIYDITDKNNIRRIGFNNNGGDLDFVINNSTTDRKILVNGEAAHATFIEPVEFRNIDPTEHNYVIITHKSLHAPSGSVTDPIRSYAAYRATNAGGNFDTLSVDVDVLYNQFTYGEKTPLAIRRFVDFLLEGDQLEYVFLIGKGLSLATKITSANVYYRQSPSSFSLQDLVPTHGVPGSDAALIANINDNTHVAPVPIGRLNAINSKEVVDYLNKVIEKESTPFNALWRKNLIHLSGGQTVAELIQFASYVDGYKNTAEAEYLGGKVMTFNKSSNSVVQLFNISDEVNKGASMITFYGHSGTAVTDIEIGYVSNELLGYANKGRYPVILVNGCNAGDVFNNSVTFGEDWMREKDRGAVNFLAHTSTGFVSQLRFHTDKFYETAFGDSLFVAESIGRIQQEANKRFLDTFGTSEKNITQTQEVVLQGDPANKIFGASLPDYAITKENVFFQSLDGGPVSASDEFLRIGVIVENYGVTYPDSLTINVNRTLSDGTSIIYDTINYAPVNYLDTLFYDVPMGGKAFGNNNFEIQLDGRNVINEISENNNIAFPSFFIPVSGTNNILPFKYAIVNSQPVKLITQATNPFSETRMIQFEIDTISTFNSPFKLSNTVEGRILASWETNLLSDVPANDSIVYFWRTKYVDVLSGEEDQWSESSFIYIKNSPEGWSQSHKDQYQLENATGLVINDISEKWEFLENQTSVEVITHGADHPESAPANVVVDVSGIPFIISSPGNRLCRNNSINALAFDHQSGLPYVVLKFTNRDVTDLRRCGRLPQLINNFVNGDITSASVLFDQYMDGVAENDHVLMFSIGNLNYDQWNPSTLTKLEEFGVDNSTIPAMTPGEPLIILGRKGDAPGSAIIRQANPASPVPTTEQQISLSEVIFSKYKQGKLNTDPIGPALSWNNFVNETKISETPQTDVFVYDIFGVNVDGEEILLFDDINIDNLDLSGIDADNYPYLRIRYDILDEVNQTPSQLNKWQVFYQTAPEGVLYLPEESVTLFDDEKQEGELVESNFIFENISNKAFEDSLTVNYSLFNKTTKQLSEENFKIDAPEPGTTSVFNISFNTQTNAGKNSLNIFVNPRIEAEQNYNNNIVDIPNGLIVKKDTLNPVLDVAFDGVYILDGEIVSPDPLITVNLNDQNSVLFKEDTTGITIQLGVPCEECPPSENCQSCEFKLINFTDPGITWVPADENQDFRVEFKPGPLEDGIYTLLIQASDASGNLSGISPYKIRFEVINASTITNFYPYPNPFSTNVRFVYTLTGSEIPNEFKIQIMTVSGKIVREITQDEMGPLRIGNNISDFAWDGKDEYGDQLANGVYLYRVLMGNNTTDFEHRDTAADKAFKKGFGKIYLLK